MAKTVTIDIHEYIDLLESKILLIDDMPEFETNKEELKLLFW